jgi:hypothetical protein
MDQVMSAVYQDEAQDEYRIDKARMRASTAKKSTKGDVRSFKFN